MRKVFLILILLRLLSPAAFAGGDVVELADVAGREVSAVEIRGATISSLEMVALIPVTVGEPLSPQQVREGVLNLYRTGLYEHVDVRVRPGAEGIALRYDVVPRRWLEEVEFEGNLHVSDSELVRKVNLSRNEEISKDRLEENTRRLAEYFAFRGYPGTVVDHRVEAGRENRTRVIFEIAEGEPVSVSRIELAGNAGFSRLKLLRIIASAPGGRFDGEKVDSDLKKIRKHLMEQLYLTPEVTWKTEPAEDFPRSVVLTYSVDSGPVTRIHVEMDDPKESARIERRVKKTFIARGFTETSRNALSGALTSSYRSDGYPFTAMSWSEDLSEPGVKAVTLSVDRGTKTSIGSVRVSGVQFLGSDRLHQVLGLELGGPFVKQRLDEGVRALEREYRFEGFPAVQVQVRPLNFRRLNGNQEADIDIVVQEGERVILEGLRVAGGPWPEERMKGIAGIEEGKGYVPELIERGRESLLQALASDGYLYAGVSVKEPEKTGDGTVQVTLNVTEGPRVRLGSVIISGNENVSPRIIRLAMDLKRGQIVTRDQILQAQERIYDLGVMNSVDVQLADPEQPEEFMNLLVTVRERPRYVVGFKVGYGSEDGLRAGATLTHRNVGSMARKLTLQGRTSQIQKSATLLYTHPWFLSKPIELSLNLTDVLEERESYTRDSLLAAVHLVRKVSEKTETRIGYSYEGLKLRDVSADAQLSPDDVGKTDVAAVSGEIIYDDRDDFFDPYRGILGDLILEVASKELGSEAEYGKVEVAMHRYLPLGGRKVLAGLFRVGGVLAFGQSEDVLISKRFFLGGQNSVRGYRLDSLGPRDADGDPVGGNYMLNLNLELRFGLYKKVRGVVFVDSGSVWLDHAGTVSDADFGLLYAGGAGLRWSSPIGPLSLDYGYKLNPVEEDEGDRSRWHFSIGHAF